MKNHSSARAQKGKTAYNTPHRWIAERPEAFKRKANTKLTRKQPKFFKKPW